ncbi:MAG: outer membrane lipoprotein-sorting protein [Lentimicrobium sp.]|nr:outer membrane lipoprotein-sorting protein [Lentimicrobium sp.]
MKNKILIFGTLMLVIIFAGETRAQDAAGILKKMDEVLYAPKDQTGQLRMVLTDRSGNERIREASIWQKGTDKRMFRFTAPASESGIAFLSLPADVMYLFMPAFEKERRIATHVKNQPFAGTDFSYEDMESVSYSSKYTPKLLKETAEYWLLELTPKSGLQTNYSKIEMKVNKQHAYPESMESFDKGGNKLKTVENTYEKEGKYWYPKEIKMTDLKKRHSTRMIMTKVVFDSNLSDQIFTVRNLTSF